MVDVHVEVRMLLQGWYRQAFLCMPWWHVGLWVVPLFLIAALDGGKLLA